MGAFVGRSDLLYVILVRMNWQIAVEAIFLDQSEPIALVFSVITEVSVRSVDRVFIGQVSNRELQLDAGSAQTICLVSEIVFHKRLDCFRKDDRFRKQSEKNEIRIISLSGIDLDTVQMVSRISHQLQYRIQKSVLFYRLTHVWPHDYIIAKPWRSLGGVRGGVRGWRWRRCGGRRSGWGARVR